MEHRAEVCSLSRGVMLARLNPYPRHYGAAFAFSAVLYPHPHGLALRLAFPSGRGTGEPTFRSMTYWMG